MIRVLDDGLHKTWATAWLRDLLECNSNFHGLPFVRIVVLDRRGRVTEIGDCLSLVSCSCRRDARAPLPGSGGQCPIGSAPYAIIAISHHRGVTTA